MGEQNMNRRQHAPVWRLHFWQAPGSLPILKFWSSQAVSCSCMGRMAPPDLIRNLMSVRWAAPWIKIPLCAKNGQYHPGRGKSAIECTESTREVYPARGFRSSRQGNSQGWQHGYFLVPVQDLPGWPGVGTAQLHDKYRNQV